MIEKKTPKVSDTVEPAAAAGGGTSPSIDTPSGLEALRPDLMEPGHAEPETEELHADDLDSEDVVVDDYDIDPVEEARKRKQRSNMIFYGGIAAMAVIFGFVAYPHFKKYFVPEAPHQQLGNVPFPEAATKHHFSLTADDTKPAAPSGGMTGPGMAAMPSVPGEGDATQPQAAPIEDSDAQAPTAIAPHIDAARTDLDTLMKSNSAAPALPLPETAGGTQAEYVAPAPAVVTTPKAVSPPPVAAAPPPKPIAPRVVAAPLPAVAPAPTVAPPPAMAVQKDVAVVTPPVAVAPRTLPSVTPVPPAVTHDVTPSGPSSAMLPPPAPNSATAAANTPGAAAALPPQPQQAVGDLATKVATLQTTVSGLNASRDADDARLQQIQASLDKLQKEIADLSRIEPSAPAPREAPRHTPSAEPVAVRAASVPHPAVKWILRGATPDMALLSHPDDQALQRVAVGDMVSGLGRITSISEHDGRWVVQGTKGSVVQ